MKKYKYLFIILLILIISSPVTYSQKIIRHVVGSGGKTIQDNNLKVNCTFGQTQIGLVKSTDVLHGVGYWYEAAYLMSHPNPVTVVLIPFLSAEISSHVTVPIILQESKYFSLNGPRSILSRNLPN